MAVVTWDSASEAVRLEWQGWADSSEIVALNEAGLRALIEHHGSRLLSDSRSMKVIKQSDQDWINQDLFPPMPRGLLDHFSGWSPDDCALHPIAKRAVHVAPVVEDAG